MRTAVAAMKEVKTKAEVTRAVTVEVTGQHGFIQRGGGFEARPVGDDGCDW